MKYRAAITILVASVLALTSLTSFAGNGQSGQSAARTQQPDRDRLNIHHSSRMKDQDIYGNELMTVEERRQYREQLGNENSPESRMEFQAQHEEMMQKRALVQGRDLVPPGQGPVYDGEHVVYQIQP